MQNPLRAMSWPTLRGDLFGGLTAAVVALPLALAVGVQTHVGAAAGLYGAIFSGIFAALFGGTATQITGPTLTTMAVVLACYATGGWSQLALATVICGLLQIVFGLLRLGRFVTYIPQPVIAGFTNGMAVYIFAKQIPTFSAAPVIALLTIAVMWFWPRITKAVPGPLVALVLTTGLAAFLGWTKSPYLFWGAAPTIGAIPSGFPLFHLPDLSVGALGPAFKVGLTLALIASMESLLSSLVVDEMTGTKHKLNQELIGQGIGNVVTAFFRGIVGNGAIVRSVVNTRSGAHTRWSGVIHGLVILIITISFGSLAEQVPTATLAGILMMTAVGMVDWQSIRDLRSEHVTDAAVMIVTAVLTYATPLAFAIAAGFLLSALLFFLRMTSQTHSPATAIKVTVGVQKSRVELTQIDPRIAVLTVDGPLFFGDANQVQEQFECCTGSVIGDLSRMTVVDATGALMLRKQITKLRSQGRPVHICGLHHGPRRMLEALGVLGDLHLHDDLETAVTVCRTQLAKEGATA